MTRASRSRYTRDFYDTLATELESHLGNGSEFIFLEGQDDAPKEIVDLRIKILKQEIRRLRKKGASL